MPMLWLLPATGNLRCKVSFLSDILPAPLAWLRLPEPGQEPLDLPSETRIYWYREDAAGNVWILIEHSSLHMIEPDDEIPTLRPIWQHQPPMLHWEAT